MDIRALRAQLEAEGEKPYRTKQILAAFGSGTHAGFREISELPKYLRDILTENVPWLTVTSEKDFQAADGTMKTVFRLEDGALVEGVMLTYENGRHTVCCSCEVGCAMNCAFCATGKMGFKRHLTPYEITDQIAYFDQKLKRESNGMEKVDNVVFMGMGEPFHNYESVAEAIKLLQDPSVFGLGARRVSVSTSGVVPGIEKLAKDFPQVNLAISLHAADDETRTYLMPINKAYPLEKLQKACLKYVDATNRKVMFEYLLIKGVNDSPEHAKRLGKWMSASPLFHLNLIKYHPIDHAKELLPEGSAFAAGSFKEPSFDDVHRFGGMVRKEFPAVSLTIRRTFGEEVEAACGQLAKNNQK